jgi:hypothetical protein
LGGAGSGNVRLWHGPRYLLPLYHLYQATIPLIVMTRRLYTSLRAKLGKKRFTVKVTVTSTSFLMAPPGPISRVFLLPMVRLSVAAVAEDRVRAGEASGSWTPFFHQMSSSKLHVTGRLCNYLYNYISTATFMRFLQRVVLTAISTSLRLLKDMARRVRPTCRSFVLPRQDELYAYCSRAAAVGWG